VIRHRVAGADGVIWDAVTEAVAETRVYIEGDASNRVEGWY